MKLEEIIKGITVSEIIGNTTKEISGINIDSRLIEPEHVFVAVKGTQTDGHAYITKAIEKGAVGVVCETLPETLNENITYIYDKKEYVVSFWDDIYLIDSSPFSC